MENSWEYVDRNTCDELDYARKAEKEKMYETRVENMKRQGRLKLAWL